jgi:hypothetical protein
MIYIHKIGSINRREGEELDVKSAWKVVSPKLIRRTDRFIQLSLLGAYTAVGEDSLDKGTALYMVSGQGNLAVFKRLRDQRYIHKLPPKPVDFINSLSNTAGFYVAQFFDLYGKNLNVSRQGLVVENILLLAQVSNWMLLTAQEKGALASIDVITKQMDITEVKQYMQSVDSTCKVAFGQRCSDETVDTLMQDLELDRFRDEGSCGFYETAALYTLNRFVKEGSGELLFIDTFKENFRLVKVNLL